MATIVTGGDYKVEVSTGYDATAFYLDYSTLDGPDVLDGTGEEFVDVTTYCTSIRISRGRQQKVDAFGAGTCTIAMHTIPSDRSLDPLNTAGTFWNPIHNQAGIAPLRAMRVSRNSEYLFKGRISTFQPVYGLGDLTRYTLSAIDDFFVLGQQVLTETNVPEQTSSERITTVLDSNEVEYPSGTRNITASPVATLSGQNNIDNGTNVMTYLNKINEAEQGRMFISRAGNFTFQPRIGASLGSPSIVFNDIGTGIKYNALEVEFNQQGIVNSTQVTNADSGSQTKTDTDDESITQYFIQTKSITDCLLSTNAQAQTLATYLLDPQPLPRFTGVQTTFAALTDAQKTLLSNADIGDTISVTKTFTTGTPTTNTQYLAIEGIEHEITVNKGHQTTMYTSQVSIFNALILDDPLYGLLDSTNVLT